MNLYKTFSSAIILVIALTIFGTTNFAQKQDAANDDKILAAGNPAVRQSDVFVLIEFYEWLLEKKFDAAQRQQFQTLIVDEARSKPAARTAIAEINAGFRKIQAADKEQSRRVRDEFLPSLLAEMKANESDPINKFLLGIYRSEPDAETADGSSDAPSGDAGATVKSAAKLGDLAGTWTTASVSGERYRSLITGELSDPGGTVIEYEISPGGVVKYASYFSNTLYGCTTQMFVYKSGRVSVNGSKLTFDYAPGKRTQMVCTGANKREATIPAKRTTVAFRLERDERGSKLCTTDEDGVELCLRRAGE